MAKTLGVVFLLGIVLVIVLSLVDIIRKIIARSKERKDKKNAAGDESAKEVDIEDDRSSNT